MDDARFEALVRAVASRRSVAAGLAAAAAAAMGSIGLPGSGPRRQAAAQECAGDGMPCGGMACCDGFVCNAAFVCVAAQVVTPECGGEGASCDAGCCDGLVCTDANTCAWPVQEGGGTAGTCAGYNESCAELPCCDGLACKGGAVCIAVDAAAQCAFAGESCAVLGCCAGATCGVDLLCIAAGGGEAAPACSGQGLSCAELACCDGLVCGGEGICITPADGGATEAPACRWEGDPCGDVACCDGFVCGGEGICVVPAAEGAPPAEGGEGGQVTCAFEGEYCEFLDCCDGLGCGPDLLCVPGGDGGGRRNRDQGAEAEGQVVCAFEGEYCEYLDCCEGLTCSADFACVPGEGRRSGGGNAGESGGGGGNNRQRADRAPKPEDDAPKPPRDQNAPRPDRTPKPGQPAGTQGPAVARQKIDVEPFVATLPQGAIPDAQNRAYLLQIVTVAPGREVEMKPEDAEGFPGVMVDQVLEGTERIVSDAPATVYREGSPDRPEEIPAGQEVTLEPGDGIVRRAEAGWTVVNGGTAPLRLLHAVLNENGTPPPPPGWSWKDYQFARPIPEGPAGEVKVELREVELKPGETLPAPAPGASQAAVQDFADERTRTVPLVPNPDGSARYLGTKDASVFVLTVSPVNAG